MRLGEGLGEVRLGEVRLGEGLGVPGAEVGAGGTTGGEVVRGGCLGRRCQRQRVGRVGGRRRAQ